MRAEDSICRDCIRIGERIKKAIEDLYRISAAYKGAKPGSFESGVLSGQLSKARAEQRASSLELRKHIDECGCRRL